MSDVIVIGYDQSAPSEAALAQAAREAHRRGAALRVVHAYHFARPATPMVIPPPAVQQQYARAAARIAQAGAEHARVLFPDLSVQATAEAGAAWQVLADACHDADLLVVGNRGRGGFTGLLLGSVSMRTLGRVGCPVIVVRGSADESHGRIVAAVDIDEPACGQVLSAGFDLASRRSAYLDAIYVWDEQEFRPVDDAPQETGLAEPASPTGDDHHHRLAALVEDVGTAYPGVKAFPHIAVGSPARLLVDESERADLVVTGAHRHGGDEHQGMHVGPVTTTLLHHAACPIAVVPHD